MAAATASHNTTQPVHRSHRARVTVGTVHQMSLDVRRGGTMRRLTRALAVLALAAGTLFAFSPSPWAASMPIAAGFLGGFPVAWRAGVSAPARPRSGCTATTCLGECCLCLIRLGCGFPRQPSGALRGQAHPQHVGALQLLYPPLELVRWNVGTQDSHDHHPWNSQPLPGC